MVQASALFHDILNTTRREIFSYVFGIFSTEKTRNGSNLKILPVLKKRREGKKSSQRKVMGKMMVPLLKFLFPLFLPGYIFSQALKQQSVRITINNL